ncbi:glycosyltransferase family 4 protein [Synechococcus sp. CCY9201]|uniref:glycosyltransferase family 4 protein n=1 Tax=unclassified Synechococcus TaxID=2626047 RepID=UPI0018CE7A50|nr:MULTISPECIES: glycosyltransferase family 4 protein [unclassified Synechococcus]MEA5422238.1 glycosyltransferase family 4 protein [Synechococcus sp. CCY9202]MEA5472768.1 glycosyltransferase family 4 protein [Synechococcus sp. CCY9201]QPN60967.1 glycosyltransferase [Synechococcus sp. CBW1002]QPN67339.1 glycosyltransferase [Synechococcus sp. CBW1006]CAK6702008.1 D-inositol-3-phosphate glycosyltransferase [Synechococcus sp. CBW1107]
MNILFVHQNFPGQYRHIVRALAKAGGNRLVALAIEEPSEPIPAGVTHVRYGIRRASATDLQPWVQDVETKTIRGEACATAAHRLREQGFSPDLICGHPGWGEMLFLRDLWPEAPILTYQEFFYQAHGFDYDFDPELQGIPSWQDCARIRMKTANLLLNLEISNWSVTPTAFQRSSFPPAWRSRLSVIHDGIDTHHARPRADAPPLTLPDGTTLRQGEPIVTFVNRCLEPYRGCHTMIRAIPELQRLAPEARLVIVGRTEGVSYGAVCQEGEWKDRFLAEIEGQFDPSRVHFSGHLPYKQFIPLLQLSAAHVYLTYPFVLSWSLLEAMSCAAAVVGSATAPVQEVIRHGHNGLLVDFFSPAELAASVAELLANRPLAERLGAAARATVLADYSLKPCLSRQLALMSLVASRAVG